MRISRRHFFVLFFTLFWSIASSEFFDILAQEPPGSIDFSLVQSDPEYQEDVQFFVEVFQTMQKNYYQSLNSDDLKKFIYIFGTRLFPRLKAAQKSQKYIKWRSAAYLVDALKEEEDVFSKFFPPKDAEKYETEVLGKRIDLGIDGKLTDDGYEVTWVEPRSDAYEQGLRQLDVIYQIARKRVETLTEEEIQELLTPLEGEKIMLRYIQADTKKKKKITLLSREYFKQLAFMVSTGVESVFCIQIQRFNRKTGEDLTAYMEQIRNYPGPTSLIIDLRGNPGGPPLAAREISAFFLKPGEDFAYFQMRRRPRANLDVPEIPEEYHYDGDMVILINEKSGSAAELFSGILQRKGRAELMGVNSAGQVFLKSMFYFSDQSMVLLVTARGHHPDGAVFSFDGLDPDVRTDDREDEGLIRYAANYLIKKRQE